MKAFIKIFNSDPAVKDPPRVLRLPFTYWCKLEKNPNNEFFMCKLHTFNDVRYSTVDIQTAIDKVDPALIDAAALDDSPPIIIDTTVEMDSSKDNSSTPIVSESAHYSIYENTTSHIYPNERKTTRRVDENNYGGLSPRHIKAIKDGDIEFFQELFNVSLKVFKSDKSLVFYLYKKNLNLTYIIKDD